MWPTRLESPRVGVIAQNVSRSTDGVVQARTRCAGRDAERTNAAPGFGLAAGDSPWTPSVERGHTEVSPRNLSTLWRPRRGMRRNQGSMRSPSCGRNWAEIVRRTVARVKRFTSSTRGSATLRRSGAPRPPPATRPRPARRRDNGTPKRQPPAGAEGHAGRQRLGRARSSCRLLWSSSEVPPHVSELAARLPCASYMRNTW